MSVPTPASCSTPWTPTATACPDRDADGQVVLASDPFDPSMGIEFNEDVQIAALRLFGKLGRLPSNLDETGANLGYATYDIDAIRLTQNFTYQFDNGWEARFSAMRMQNKDVRFRKNGSFRAVLLGLQGELGPEPGVSDYANAFHWYNPFSTSALNCRYRVCTDPGAATSPNLGDYPNAQYVADTIDINAIRLLKTSLTSYDVLATGDLFEGWAGTIAGAFGAEYRSYKLNWDSRSDENQCNNWYDACNFDYSAKDTITSMFFELGVPLLNSDTAGFAELQVAGRYSDYQDIGSTFDPKIAALYQPTNWLSLRASYSESFIAPSIPDRFDPGGSFLQSTNDPLFNDFEGTYRTNTTSGNPDLRPETAQVYNLGFSMAFLDGDLNFGLDYSNYDFVDRITLLRGPRVVGADFDKFLEAFPQQACSACQTGQSYDVNRDDALAWLSQQDSAIVRGGPPSYTIVEVRATRINANKMVHTAWDAYGDYTLEDERPWRVQLPRPGHAHRRVFLRLRRRPHGRRRGPAESRHRRHPAAARNQRDWHGHMDEGELDRVASRSLGVGSRRDLGLGPRGVDLRRRHLHLPGQWLARRCELDHLGGRRPQPDGRVPGAGRCLRRWHRACPPRPARTDVLRQGHAPVLDRTEAFGQGRLRQRNRLSFEQLD